jgi:diguanylate cyclase (GGDEF)-like protein/PAS domain S-box-containing protein
MTLNPGGARLLVVDDDLIVRDMAAQTLRHAGFEVLEAESGEEALSLLEHEAIDLLLLDVMLPGIDGHELCRRLRALPHGERLPILMLTGLNDTASIDQAYRSGATDFIAKPINWTLLAHRVRYGLRASAAAEGVLRSRERLARAQQLASMGSWELAADSGRIVSSGELARIFGTPVTGTDGQAPPDFLDRICENDRAQVHAARDAALRDGTPYQLTFTIERFDGQARTVFEQAVAVRDGLGRVTGIEAITQDVTDRIEAQRQIRRLALNDSLTALPNRDFFCELAGPALHRAWRLGSECAVLHIDLDRFKSVNDAFGRTVGDQVLRTASERLQACIRAGDLATIGRPGAGSEVLARVGSNAFTMLLMDVGGAADVASVAQRLMDALAQPLTVAGSELILSASIGIALFPRDANNVEALMGRAEQALYAAKAAGRAQHRFFDEAMNAQAGARLARESDLRRAIADGELRLHFQPKMDALSGRMVGAEALVRWQHPKRGLLLPGEFIPLAEEVGLIVPLGDWVMRSACEALRRWRALRLATIPLSINLSAPSFLQEGLVQQLDALLLKFGLHAKQLTIEVTESLLMQDVGRTVERLQALRERGFGLSLDDFGTGFSSLSYLKRFPIDELKIDRSFVKDVGRGGKDGALVASIIALGGLLDLRVVAEGVETRAQSDFLIAHGCNQQQGYLFARPMPAEDLMLRLLPIGAAPARHLISEHRGQGPALGYGVTPV